MRTLAHKQSQPRERASSSLARSSATILGPPHHTNPLLHLHRADGDREKPATISSPADAFEREADDVANKVMRMAEPDNSVPVAVQRKCAECADEKMIQTSPTPLAHSGAALDAGAAVRAAGRGGVPLSKEVRSYFEPRFGHDYTAGRDIVFGSGEYAPATIEGKRLLAHELTHVVQQESAPAAGQQQHRSAVAASAAGAPVRLPLA